MNDLLEALLADGGEVVFTPLLFDGEELRYFAMLRTEQDAAVGSGDTPEEAVVQLHERWSEA